MLLAAVAVLFSPLAGAQQATATPVAAETPQPMLAVQIRMQGFSCDKPLGGVRDTKRSRPDRGVWVLEVQQRNLSDHAGSGHGRKSRTTPMTDSRLQRTAVQLP